MKSAWEWFQSKSLLVRIVIVVVVVGVLGAALTDDETEAEADASTTTLSASPPNTVTDEAPSTTQESTTSTSTSTTTTSEPPTTTTEATPTTTEPTTTTIEDTTIGSGVWLVGSEVQSGVYRVAGYWARLDADQEIIDNDLVGENGLTLVNILETDAFIDVNGAMIPLDDTRSLDPIAEGFTEGTYLVGYDIEPGQYRIVPENEGDHAYWARLGENRDLIDNDLAEGPLVLTVRESDWAISFTGVISLLEE